MVFVTAGRALVQLVLMHVRSGEGLRCPVGAETNRRKKLAGFHGAERYIASLKIEQHEQGVRPGGKKSAGTAGTRQSKGPNKLEKEPTMPAAGTAGT